jgi:hypothetical protein
MLVHMAPKEVAGLQALAMAHGGSLTVNPQTGLPEAGFLKNLLPTLIGAGLMFATGGTGAALIPGLSNAATIGLGIGGLQALRTGSLRKGLMAGLGAYGGAGMMGSVLGAGATGAANAASTEAIAAGDLAAQQAVTPSIGGVTGAVTPPSPVATLGTEGSLFSGPEIITPQVAPPTSFTPTNGAFSYEQMRSAGLSNAEIAQSARDYAANLKGTAQSPFNQATQQAMANPLSTGIKAIADKPSSFFTKDNLKYGAAALAPTMFQEPEKADVPRDTEQFRYAYSPGPAMPPTRMGDVGEYTYFRPSYTRLAADGGLMDLPVERMSDRNEAMMGMANGGQMYAAGELSHLGDYSDGGRLLRGPGDGVSDNIPATIANKRPARLADGEFVVPARIVSELGNGSTEAGARKLYAMMDRVQKNRNKTVGKGRVAVDSRSEKLLPA